MFIMEEVNYSELDLTYGRKRKKTKGRILELLNNFVDSDYDCVKVKDINCDYNNNDTLARCIMNCLKYSGLDKNVKCFVLDHEVYLKRKWGNENGKDEQGSDNSIVQSDK